MPAQVLQEKEMVQLADAAPPHLALTRRGLIGQGLRLGAAAALASASVGANNAEAVVAKDSLLTIPVEVTGSWGGSLPQAAGQVILRMRAACLGGVRLLSDRQPDRLRVEDHASGPPAIWLHSNPLTTAWVIVDIGARDWSKLAYQFGHELGHVLCNSWNAAAWPRPPCRWLEESMVEAFSIRGLGRLADDWQRDPPFRGDNAFSASIRQYREDLVRRYQKAGGQAPGENLAQWFRANQAVLDSPGGLCELLGPAIVAIIAEYAADNHCVEDLGALNRWPERTALPIADYLSKWEASCRELNAPGHLPSCLRNLLGVG
jgi:hypothetical protein